MTREEAIKIIEVLFKSKEAYKHNDSVTHQALNMAIEALQTDIVRCKDCRYRKKVGTSYYCELDEFNVKGEDFCSWGERR